MAVQVAMQVAVQVVAAQVAAQEIPVADGTAPAVALGEAQERRKRQPEEGCRTCRGSAPAPCDGSAAAEPQA